MTAEVVRTPLSSMLLVFVGAFIGSFAGVFLKASSGRLQFSIPALLANWRLMAGALTYLISSVFFIWGVRNGELSILYPLVSLGYLWTMVWSKVFFGEPISAIRKFLQVFAVSLVMPLVGIHPHQ